MLAHLSIELEDAEGFAEENVEFNTGDAVRAPCVEVSFFNPSGPASNFRSVTEMQKEFSNETEEELMRQITEEDVEETAEMIEEESDLF